MKSRIRVVIVDDNETTRAALRLAINGQPGFTVVGEAVDGDSGLNTVLALRPQIICLDISMPGSSGLDVLSLMRQFLPGTAVVMVSASNDAVSVHTALARGAAGFIVKPFRPAAVHDALLRAARTTSSVAAPY